MPDISGASYIKKQRSAANPNIAAMIVDMLTQCGVKAGDPVAVNCSGSFPGLNVSVLCALDGSEHFIHFTSAKSFYHCQNRAVVCACPDFPPSAYQNKYNTGK